MWQSTAVAWECGLSVLLLPSDLHAVLIASTHYLLNTLTRHTAEAPVCVQFFGLFASY